MPKDLKLDGKTTTNTFLRAAYLWYRRNEKKRKEKKEIKKCKNNA